jgi:DNA-binding transcriptional regulator/RsmH inhibitor MraZ
LSKFTPQAAPPKELLKFDHFNVSMTFTVAVDKQGRLVLPEKIIRRTGVRGEVTVAGARDHIEIWPRAEWEAYSEENPGDVAFDARKAAGEGDKLV